MSKSVRLTMAEADKIARAQDPELRERLTREEQRELVKAVNDHAGKQRAAEDLLRRMMRPHAKH